MTPVKFAPTFPCFSILANDCSNPFTVTANGKLALAVFKSEEDLKNFRANGEAMGPTIHFDFPESLALYIDSLPQNVTMIAFHSGQSGQVVYVPAGELYGKLLERTKK